MWEQCGSEWRAQLPLGKYKSTEGSLLIRGGRTKAGLFFEGSRLSPMVLGCYRHGLDLLDPPAVLETFGLSSFWPNLGKSRQILVGKNR